MTVPNEVRPAVVAVSSEFSFLHLIQTLLDNLGLPVRTTADWESAAGLVQRLRPRLVVLDLAPGRERACWLCLMAIRAHTATRSIPVLICPVAPWLLAGHEALLARDDVQVWTDDFDLEDLLTKVQVAVAV
jgi:CheY-like chemotaxis protein